MHRHFADWYREVDLEENQETLQARWEGVESFAKELSPSLMPELVRLLFGKATVEIDFVDSLREAFRENDENFPGRGNEREIAVLSGATLAQVLESETTSADVAALALLTQTFLPYDEVPPRKDLVQAANQYLRTRCVNLRRDIQLTAVTPTSLAVEKTLTELKAQCEAGTNVASAELGKAIVTHLSRASKSVNRIDRAIAQIQRDASRALTVLSEECNILWWVLGERSLDLQLITASLEPGAASIIAGKELAEQVHIPPGPASAITLLDKMIRSGRDELPEELSIEQAINVTPRDWRENIAKNQSEDPSDTVCPLHLALEKSLTTEGGRDWGPAYRMATGGVEFSHSARPIDIALQFYRETMLVSLLTA